MQPPAEPTKESREIKTHIPVEVKTGALIEEVPQRSAGCRNVMEHVTNARPLSGRSLHYLNSLRSLHIYTYYAM